MFDSWRSINEMKTLKGVGTWIVSELRVLWYVACFVVEMLIKWVLFQFPSTKARIIADIEQRVPMQPFTGNWQVRHKKI